MIGFSGWPVAAQQLRIQSHETPAGVLEGPTLFAEVRHKRARRASLTLRHFAGDDVVADVVIAGR